MRQHKDDTGERARRMQAADFNRWKSADPRIRLQCGPPAVSEAMRVCVREAAAVSAAPPRLVERRGCARYAQTVVWERVMHFESVGVETGDPAQPYMARITFGTRNRQELLHEWPAGTLNNAQQQADDWLSEYCARLHSQIDERETIADAKDRLKRLARYQGIPELPPVPPGPWPTSMPHWKSGNVRDAIAPDPAVSQPEGVVVSGLKKTIRSRVKQVVSMAKGAGIDVVGIRVWPDGSIAAFDGRSSFMMPLSTDAGGN